ncbi:MAG: hypothetical protein R3D31_04530 [Hyphomicrobiaceae bacterium]
MSLSKVVNVAEIEARGSIKDTDVLKMRRAFYEDGAICESEAETLLHLNEACHVQDPSWSDFLIEAITDYVVNQANPHGYVTADNATWLLSRIEKDGRVDTKTELELVIHVIERARWSPESLVAFALAQVKHAVIEGTGPIRSGQSLTRGVIGESEVELLRRILYAFGGDGAIGITRSEAEVLFDISDATAEADNHPAWAELFAKAVASVVMVGSGYAPPSREEALRRERWLEEPTESFSTLKRTLSTLFSGPRTISDGLSSEGGMRGTLSSYTRRSAMEEAMARLERQRVEIITNEAVTEGEAAWLVERIGRDGKVSETERELLAFLKRESPSIHPSLLTLIEKAAA